MAADILAARGAAGDCSFAAKCGTTAARNPIPPLPTEIANGVLRLTAMRPPRIERPDLWAGVVADARRLVDEGWAAMAIALGWSAADLFGVGPKGDWDFQGLAVWLNGDSVVMLDEARSVAVDASGNHRYFTRGGMRHGTHPTINPVMLWQFGRG